MITFSKLTKIMYEKVKFISNNFIMHIKEAYLRRIEEEQTPKKKSMDHSQIIGSKHTGQVNYDFGVSFFSDVKRRESVNLAKRQSLDFKDPDILELKDKRWNNSVLAPNRFDNFAKEESHKSKLLKISLGLTEWDQVSPGKKPYYVGTETRDDFTGWNVSSFIDRKQKNQGQLRTNLNALDNTIKFNSTKLHNYKKLQDRYEETRQMQKSQLLNSKDIIEDLKASYRFNHPCVSPTSLDGASKRMFQQYKIEKMQNSLYSTQTDDSLRNFKAKLSPTQKMNMKVKYFHSGNYARNSPQKQKFVSKKDMISDSEDEVEDKQWSCCMKSDENAKGCCKKVIDRNKMNLEAFNL